MIRITVKLMRSPVAVAGVTDDFSLLPGGFGLPTPKTVQIAALSSLKMSASSLSLSGVCR